MTNQYIDINNLSTLSANIGANERIIVQGNYASQWGIKLDSIKLPNWASASIIDFSQFTFPYGIRLEVKACENIIAHKPVIDMDGIDDHAIKVSEDSDSVVINAALTDEGQSGILLTDGTKNSIVFRSMSTQARIDGMQCHKSGSSECGNSNAFIECIADAKQEEAFDIASGQSHLLIDCSVSQNGSNNGVHIGHGASARIMNMYMPSYKIQVKECTFLEIMGSQNIKQLVFRSQGGNGLPQNVKWYGPELVPVANIENLNLSSFYSTHLSHEGFIPSNIRAKLDEKLQTVLSELY